MKRSWIRAAVLSCGLAWALSATAEPRGNVLSNGDFEAAEPAWLFHTEKDAKATFRVEREDGNAFGHVEVTHTGKNNHVQFACRLPQSALAVGEVHRATFRCRSSQPRNMRVALIEANAPWHHAGLTKNVQVTSGWHVFELHFRPKAVPSPDLKLDFLLGDVAGDFWLDDVSLAAVPAGQGRPATVRLLISGDSELGLGGDGSILSLKSISSGLEVVGGIGQRPAFTLGLRRGTETASRSSADATRIVAQEGKGTYIAEFPDMTVRFSYEPAKRAGLFECRIAVDNRSDWAVERLTFPILECPETLGEDSEDDRFLFPHAHGELVENPRQAMAARGVTGIYPGWTSCQLMSFFDPKAGLYAACHDTAGNVKTLSAELAINLHVEFSHLRPLLPGTDVVLPYPVVIGTFPGGTWHEPASIYRDWSLAQKWLPRPLKENALLPEWMRGGAIVDFHTPFVSGSPLTDEQFRQRLDAIRKVSGLNVLGINWGWERYGMWCAQEYFPARPSDEAFRRHGAITCETGAGMVMLSGLRWTFEKQLTGDRMYSGKERFDRDVKPWVTYTQNPDTPTVITTGKPTHYKGSGYAEICPGTDFAAETVVAAARRCVESGYPAIHFDQPTGAAYCLASNHGHSPGYGTWYHEGIAKLYDQIRTTCAPLDSKFVLSMEESRELYLRECQLIQTRAQRLVATTSPFARDLPLFQFLYHEYQVAWCSAYPAHCHGHIRYSLAKGFAAGLMPGLVWDWVQNIKPAEQREKYLAILGNYCRLYREEGLEFLLYGRMLKPLPIDIPTRELQITSKDGKTKYPLRVPAFYHSVWQAPDGRRAVVFFNPEDTPHSIHLPDGRDVTVKAGDGLLCELRG